MADQRPVLGVGESQAFRLKLSELALRFFALYSPIAACVALLYAGAALFDLWLWANLSPSSSGLVAPVIALATGSAFGSFLLLPRTTRWRGGKALAAGFLGLAASPGLGFLMFWVPWSVLLPLVPVLSLAGAWFAVSSGSSRLGRFRGLLVAGLPVLMLALMYAFWGCFSSTANGESYLGIFMTGVVDVPMAALATTGITALWGRPPAEVT